MNDQRQREAALRRNLGTSPEHAARLREFNATRTDWYTTCRVCKKQRQGSIAELMKGCDCGTQGQS